MQKENYSPLFVPHHCWLGEQLRGQCDETSFFWTFHPSQAGKLSVSYVFSNSAYKATLDFVSFLIFLISFFSWRSIFSFHCFRLSSFLFRNPVKNSFRAFSSNTTFVFVFLFIALLGTVFSVPILPSSEMLKSKPLPLGWKSNLFRDWFAHQVQWRGQRLVL